MVGKTKSGKPIYEASDGRYRRSKNARQDAKESAKYNSGAGVKRFPEYTAEDHWNAAEHHNKEYGKHPGSEKGEAEHYASLMHAKAAQRLEDDESKHKNVTSSK